MKCTGKGEDGREERSEERKMSVCPGCLSLCPFVFSNTDEMTGKGEGGGVGRSEERRRSACPGCGRRGCSATSLWLTSKYPCTRRNWPGGKMFVRKNSFKSQMPKLGII